MVGDRWPRIMLQRAEDIFPGLKGGLVFCDERNFSSLFSDNWCSYCMGCKLSKDRIR
jgi:hypothetical protein